jgi:hypothetical protein
MQEVENTPLPKPGMKTVKVRKSSLKKIPTPAIYQTSKPKSPSPESEIQSREKKDLDTGLKTTEGQVKQVDEMNLIMNSFNHKFKLKILAFVPEEKEFFDRVLLETWLYRPAFNNVHEFFPDSFTISNCGKNEQMLSFDSKTVHSLDVVQCKNVELRDFQIEFYLRSALNDEELIGDGILPWEEIISNDSKKTIYTIPLYHEESLKGTLKLKFSQDRPLTSDSDPRVPDILLISLDHIYRLEGTPSLYIQYKSPIDKQVLKSKVLWNYSGQSIDHEILLPSPQLVARLSQKSLIFEVWVKTQTKEDLLGLGKVSLTGLSPIYPLSLYPTVICDDYVPIVSPGKGCEVCYMKVCIAYGTSIQMHKFTSKRRTFHESTVENPSKTQNIRLGALQSTARDYGKTVEPEMVEFTFLNTKIV